MLALYKDGSELVGVDPIRDEVIKKLFDEDGVSNEEQNLKTISIVGIGGLGKTTLAKAVHDKIQAQFDCVAFVPVGQNPDLKKLLKDIFYGLDKQKFKDIHDTTKDEKLLIDQLGEFLMDKRYMHQILLFFYFKRIQMASRCLFYISFSVILLALCVPKYKAPLNFAAQQLATFTTICTYNMPMNII
jgi:hypothetical protein